MVTILSYGCSSGDDTIGQNQDMLGKWYVKGTQFGNDPMILFQHPCPTNRSYQEFLTDGTIVKTSYNTSCALSPSTTQVTWTRNGDVLAISEFSPDTQFTYTLTYNIDSITSQEMVLSQTTPTTIIKFYYTRN